MPENTLPIRPPRITLFLALVGCLAWGREARAQCIVPPGQQPTQPCNDVSPPDVQVSPESGSTGMDEWTVRFTWQDESHTLTPTITLNGTNVSDKFTTTTKIGPVVDSEVGIHGVSEGTFQLGTTNLITGKVCDEDNRCTTVSATYSRAPGPSTPPLQAPSLGSPGGLNSYAEIIGGGYRQMLLREPTAAEVRTWTTDLVNLQSGSNVRTMLRKLGSSAEFVARFITPYAPNTAAAHVYQRIMGREPTPAEGNAMVATAASSGWATAITNLFASDAYMNHYRTSTVPAPGMHVRYFDPVRAAVTVDPLTIAPIRDACLSFAAAPGTASECGDLVLSALLQPVTVGGRSYQPSLLYNSQHAHPMPAVGAWVVPSPVDVAPSGVTVVLKVSVAGGSLVERARWTWTGSDWPAGEARRIAMPFDGLDLPTGSHLVILQASFTYPDGRVVNSNTRGMLPVVNRAKSPYGQGWWPAGVEQLIPATPTTMLRVTAEGSVHTFHAAFNTPNVWVDASFARADTLRLDTQRQVYTRTLPDGTRVEYQNGLRTVTIDRLGQRTTLQYAAIPNHGLALSAIVTPLSDRSFLFHYDANGVLYAGTNWAAGQGRQTGAYHLVEGRLLLHWDYWSGRPSTGYTYDAQGRIVTRRDPAGTVTTFGYDGAGKLAQATVDMQGTGESFTARFGSQHAHGLGQPRRVADVFATIDGPRADVADVSRLWLDAWGAPARVVNAFNGASSVERTDARYPGLVTRSVGTDGVVQRNWYDALGRVDSTRVENPLGDGRNAVTRIAYDAVWKFFPVQVVRPDGVVGQAGYDPATGNRLWTQRGTDPARRVHYDYMATGAEAGQVHRVRSPLPNGQVATTTYGYDAAGNRRLSIDPRGMYSLVDRDVWGRAVDSYTPIDTVQGRSENGVRLYGVRQTVLYTKAGEDSIQFTRAPGVAIPWVYGTWATRTSVPSEGVAVEKTRDVLGQVTQLTRWIWTTNDFNTPRPPDGTQGITRSIYQYDRAGRVLAVQEGLSSPEAYGYDVAGNLVVSVSGNGHTTRMVYDAMGRLVRRTTPAVSHAEECLPNVPEGGGAFPIDCDPRGRFPFFSNDISGAYVVGEDVATYWYDAAGRLAAADNRDARIRRTYLPGGMLHTDSIRIRSVAGTDFSQAYGITYAYDLAGRPTSLYHPSNLAGSWPRDMMGYDAATGALSQITSRTGIVFDFAYDVAGRLASRTSSAAGADVLTYDAVGQVIHRTGPAFTESSRFDARGKSVWSRDAAGREFHNHFSGLGALAATEWRRTPTGGLEMEEFTTNPVGQTVWRRRANDLDLGYHAEEGVVHDQNSGRVRYVSSKTPGDWTQADNRYELTRLFYDAAGNTRWSRHLRQTRDPYNRVERGYYHGADNRLAAVQTLNEPGYNFAGERRGSFEEHRYDALGRRVLKRTRREGLCSSNSNAVDCASVVERYVWAGDDLLWETRTGDAQPSAFGDEYGAVGYTHGGGTDRPLVVWKGTGSSPESVVVPHAAWRGSFGAGTDVVGSASSRIQWPAFTSSAWHGQIMVGAPDKLWFGSLVGEMRDVSGLMYRRARFYDPQAGQFTQSDPIGAAGGLNTYGFAAGDPISYTDPHGLSAQAAEQDTSQSRALEEDEEAFLRCVATTRIRPSMAANFLARLDAGRVRIATGGRGMEVDGMAHLGSASSGAEVYVDINPQFMTHGREMALASTIVHETRHTMQRDFPRYARAIEQGTWDTWGMSFQAEADAWMYEAVRPGRDLYLENTTADLCTRPKPRQD